MNKSLRSISYVLVCLLLTLCPLGCRKVPLLVLAKERVEFTEGTAETQLVPISSGMVAEISPTSIGGLSASVQGDAIQITSTEQVMAGGYTFSVTSKNKTQKAIEITASVSKRPTPPSPPVEGPPTRIVTPLAPVEKFDLESHGVEVVAGRDPGWIRLKRGKIKSASSQSKLLKWVIEPDSGIHIRVESSASRGNELVTVHGEDGTDVVVNVHINAPPPTTAYSLKMESSMIQLLEGKDVTKSVRITAGWATKVDVETADGSKKNVPGLSADVENEPLNVFLVSPGQNYKSGDTLTVVGGKGTATLLVKSVNDKGAINEIKVASSSYTAFPGLELSTTGGSGSGARVSLTNTIKLRASPDLSVGNYRLMIHGAGAMNTLVDVQVKARPNN